MRALSRRDACTFCQQHRRTDFKAEAPRSSTDLSNCSSSGVDLTPYMPVWRGRRELQGAQIRQETPCSSPFVELFLSFFGSSKS